MRPLARVVSLFALLAGASLPFSAIASSQAQASNTVTLETLSPTALAGAVDAGPIPSSQLVTLTLTLTPPSSRTAALTQFLTDLQTAGSPSYRKWITPAEFASTYGPTADELAAATAWAQSAGLAVTATSPSGMRLTVTGYPAQVNAAFAVSLHQYQLGGHTYFASATQPSLPAAVSALFTSIEGLDNLPGDLQTYTKGPGATPATLVNGAPAALTIAALAPFIDDSVAPVLTIDSTHATGSPSTTQLAGYEALFQQAAAEGVTVLLTRNAASKGFPSGLPEITAVANPDDTADTQAATFARPAWQSAPGLPADQLRHAPDLTASSVSALASTLSSIAAKLPGGRAGNVNTILYELGPTPGLYTQADDARAGTWEAPSGLGLVDLEILAKAFPRGTGMSSVTFSLAPSYYVTYGTALTFTSVVKSNIGGATPTGSVTYQTTSGTVLCGPVTIDGSGNATCTSSTVPVGVYQAVAAYSGDGTYAGSQSSPPGGLTVTSPGSTLSGVVSTGNIVGGTYTVTITATVPAGAGSPTGNIVLNFSGTSTSYTQPLVAQTSTTSSATFTEPANTVGTSTINATCSGGNVSCPNPYTTTVTIAKATPGFTISYSPNPPVSGQSITLNATVSASGTAPVPTGSVTFFDNGTTLQSANLVNGTVTETGTVPTTATHSITATYNGDANYNTASSNSSSSSGSGAATLVATASSSSGAPNSAITVSATVTLAGATTAPGGKVVATLTLPSGPSIAVGTLAASTATTSTANISVTLPTTPGTYPLAIGCASTDTFTCNTVNLSVTVSSSSGTVASSTVITSSSYATTYGQSFTLTAGVKSAASATTTTPTGNVVFTSATLGTLATVPLTNGLASYQVTSGPAAGMYSFTAAYGGDTTFAASSGTSSAVTVAASVATITATANPTTVGTAASTTINATVLIPGSTVPPTGNVTVTVPGVLGGTYTGVLAATGTNAGSVSIAVPAPPAGAYQLQVTCAGTASFSCTPTTVALVSTAAAKIATTTTLTASPANAQSGQTVTLTATVASATTGAAAISGTVTFYNGTTQIGMGTIAVGIATASFALSGTTPQIITAQYSGDANYAPSLSAQLSLPSTLTPVTVALSVAGASGLAGSNVTLTAQVSGTISGTGTSTAAPTGTVSFYVAGTVPGLLGTVKLTPGTGSGASAAQLNTQGIPAGSQSIYAVYSGDTNFATGTSASVAVGYTDYAVVFTPASITLAPGQSGAVTLLVNPSVGFTSTIALSCTPPPNALITCSLNQTSLSGSGTVLLTIDTVAAPTAKNHLPGLLNGFKTLGGISLAALLCCLFPGRTRRRLPGLLLALLALATAVQLSGCGSGTVGSPLGGGTPLGTVSLTIDTAASNGTTGIAHDYSYQVTIAQ